jgi:hypothetical protein
MTHDHDHNHGHDHDHDAIGHVHAPTNFGRAFATGATLDDAFLTAACDALSKHFSIGHATLQIEAGDGVCKLAPEHVV